MSIKKINLLAFAYIISFCFVISAAAKSQKPIDVLFLGHQRPEWQQTYWRNFVKACAKQGINACVLPKDKLGVDLPLYTDELLRKFNVVVVQDDPIRKFRGNSTLEEREAFMKRLDQYMADGGAVIWNIHSPARGARDWTQHVGSKYDVVALPESLYDPSKTVKVSPNARARESLFKYVWTTNIAKHPVTQNVNGLLLPLVACYNWPGTTPMKYGSEWKTLVKGMESTSTMGNANKPGSGKETAKFVPEEKGTYQTEPEIIGVRENVNGAGRMMALPIDFTHLWLNFGHPGSQDAFMLNGDGTHKSDGFKLFCNAVKWLAQPSLKAGFGGFKEPSLPKTLLPPLDWKKMSFPWTDWSGYTAWWNVRTQQFVEVAPRGGKFWKGIFGPKTKAGGGSGTVDDYVEEAKKNGLSFVVFGEDPAKHTTESYQKFLADCAKNSDDTFAAIPGFVFRTVNNQLMFTVAPKVLPAADNITVDGKIKRPVEIPDQNGWGDVGCGMTELSKLKIKPYWFHIVWNVAPFVFDGPSLVDDGFKQYMELEGMGHNLFPLSLVRLNKPSEMKEAVEKAYMNIIYADRPQKIVSGISNESFPHRIYMSNGPELRRWGIINPFGQPFREGGDQFRLGLEAYDDAGLKLVTIYDANNGTIYREFKLNGEKEFSITIDESHKKQWYLIPVIEDMKGRKAYGPCMRTYQDGQRLSTMGDRFMDVSMCMGWDTDKKQLMQYGCWASGFHKGIPNAGMDPANPFADLLRVRGIDGGNIHGARCIVAPQVFTSDGVEPKSPSSRYDPKLASFDLSIVDYVTDAQFEPENKFVFANPPREMSPMKIVDVKNRNKAVRSRYRAEVTANMNEIVVTFKKNTRLEKINLALLTKNQPQAQGEYDLLFLKDAEGEFAWQFGLGERFERKGVLNIGDYIFPAGMVGGAPSVINLGPTPLNYEISSRQCQIYIDGKNQEVEKGENISANFLICTKPWKGQRNNVWIKKFINDYGIGVKPNYHCEALQGKIKNINYTINLEPENGGAVLEVGKYDLPHNIPVVLHGMSAACVGGRYDLDTKRVMILTVFDDSFATSVETNFKDNTFYLGEFVVCDNKNVKLSMAPDQKDFLLEVHNPTDKEISCEIRGASGFTPLKDFEKQMTLKPYSSQKVKLTSAKNTIKTGGCDRN